ncbi:MAG TPA: MFS transporter [Acidimicrobiales bacterium]|nr:MFS transporter [Acidimicrobiales bacterium]
MRARTSAAAFPLLMTAVLVQAAGIGVIFPLLATIQAAHHLPTYGLGLMSGAAFFTSLAAQLLLARHLDGPRARAVLLAGLAAGALSQVWFGVAGDLWSLVAARALGGVGFGVVMPAALRAGTVGADAQARGARLGRLASMQMVGITVGPLLGSSLATVGGLRAPFLSVAVAEAAVFVALLPVPVAGGAPDHDGVAVALRPSVRSRPVLGVMLVTVGLQLPYGVYDALWSRLLTDRGASTLLIGLSLTSFGLPYALLAPLGGRLAAEHPLRWAAGGLVVGSCFMASYGLVRSPVVITVLGCFEAVAQAVAVPAGYAATAAVFPDRWAATGQGLTSGAGTAAGGVAAVAAAPFYGAAGPAAVFAGGAAASIAAMLGGVALAGPGAAPGGGARSRPGGLRSTRGRRAAPQPTTTGRTP